MSVKKSLLAVDMPKGSYENVKSALKNAKFIMTKNKMRCHKIRK